MPAFGRKQSPAPSRRPAYSQSTKGRLASCEHERAPNEVVHGQLPLVLRQQLQANLLQPILEAASDHAQDTGQFDLHAYLGVEHVDDTGDGLTHDGNAEGQRVALPVFAAGAALAGQQVSELVPEKWTPRSLLV